MERREKLITGEFYHIFSRSIADFVVFNNDRDFFRMINLSQYFQFRQRPRRFSDFIESWRSQEGNSNGGFKKFLLSKINNKNQIVQIIAYCLMPTHIHLILKQLADNGISIFMGNLLNSYSRYFNTKHKRKGPLWESKFKNVLIDNDEQLLHLTRYIHLNPTTAFLVDAPENWRFSSYNEYLGKIKAEEKICQFEDILDIQPNSYREFVNDRIAYQRQLAEIHRLLIDKK